MDLSVTARTEHDTLLDLTKKTVQAPGVMDNDRDVEIFGLRVEMVEIKTEGTTRSADLAC
jgi:hypothetical protein